MGAAVKERAEEITTDGMCADSGAARVFAVIEQ